MLAALRAYAATVMAARTKILLLTGTIGAGKTVVAIEAGEILQRRSLPHSIVDLDWLAWMWLPDAGVDLISDMIARNLRAIHPNLRDAGATRLILTRALQSEGEIALIADAVSPDSLILARLVAPPELIADRLSRRDSGRILDEHLAETEAFDHQLDRLTTPYVRVMNDERQPSEVALEVLERTGLLEP